MNEIESYLDGKNSMQFRSIRNVRIDNTERNLSKYKIQNTNLENTYYDHRIHSNFMNHIILA